MRKTKLASLLFSFLLVAMLLVGCGANVSSVMTVSTADGKFSGNRVITLLIDNEDLSSVTGGMTGLETVITQNIPADLTYAIAYPSDTQSSIVFTLEFSSLDDYRTKVTNLLNANVNNDIIPEISYERHDTIFKSGLKYSENFRSFDLIEWYYNALETANIISESSSNWYEIGSDELIMDGESVDTSSQFNVDNQVKNCFDDCEVRTVMNNDGTFDRTITFYANEETITALDEVSGDIAEYMEKVAKDDIAFETEEDEYGDTSFIYTISGATVEEIVSATNTVMQNENNTFTVDVQPKEDIAGTAEVTIVEAIDGSYYLDYDGSPLKSSIVTYPNFEMIAETEESDFYSYESENEVYYYPYAGTSYTFTGDWVVGYETVELNVSASSLNKMKVELTFTICDSLADEVKDIAFSALKSACKDNGTYSKDENVATYEVSGTPEEVASSLNAFVKYYVGEESTEDEAVEEITYCTVTLSEMGTSSKLTNGICGDLSLDLSPVLGTTDVNIVQKGSTKIVSDISRNEDGELYTSSQIYIAFAATKLNVVTLILIVVFVVLLVGGALICVANRKELISLIPVKKVAPAAETEAESAVEPVEEVTTEPAVEPVEEVTAEPAVEPVTEAEAEPVEDTVSAPVEETEVVPDTPDVSNEEDDEEEIM